MQVPPRSGEVPASELGKRKGLQNRGGAHGVLQVACDGEALLEF